MRLPKIIRRTLQEFKQTPSDLPCIGIPSPEADHRAIAKLDPSVIEDFLEETRRQYFASQVGAIVSTQLQLEFKPGDLTTETDSNLG